ncbi:RNA-directed DNA polymerase, eukaryota [Tanacetum coccineum]
MMSLMGGMAFKKFTSKVVLDMSQKAKIRWSIEGDENSKYFHGILNSKRSHLFIRGILHNGDWIEDPIRVKAEFFNHFAKQFSEPSPSHINLDLLYSNCLSMDQAGELESNISIDEIKSAYWSIMGSDIVDAVNQFFSTCFFPPGCNSNFIALIPKIRDAKVIKDFRPISLIGSIYKIIAKILANRLCMVIPLLINEVQTAFVSNRQILDGPFILNELISWCKYKKMKAMIFKIDFEKAFDSVRWDYLDDILKSFGFGVKWRSWIAGCLNSAKGSVLVNGSPTAEFKFHRGLKQGDPLSPFLFILVMESLHRSFSRVMEAGLYKGISINNSLLLSHLFYADDAVFVGEWNRANITTIVRVLNCFYMASGLKINLSKSKLSGIGVSKCEVDEAAAIVGCTTLSPPFQYLGVKIGAPMSRINSWKEVTEKVSSRLSKWKIQTLSSGGRLTLIKSVLNALPLYYMSLFKAPTAVLKVLESLRSNFFNGSVKEDRKMTLVRWDKIMASKSKGGLGVSSLYASNRALLFKWIWRLHSNCTSIWAKLIKAIHGGKDGISNPNPKISGSIWQELVREFLMLKDKGIDCFAFIKRKLGNGEDTSFWNDLWLGESILKFSHPRIFALDLRKDISVAEKLNMVSLDASFRRKPRGGLEEEQFRNLASLTSHVLLPNSIDRWSWTLEGSGNFTVNSVRRYIDDMILPKSDSPTRWIKLIPIKINILAWKISLDCLPTRFILSSRGLEIESLLCPACNVSAETSSHTFFACSLARNIMHNICYWWELDLVSLNSYSDWIIWFTSIRLNKKKKEILEGICLVSWWFIWNFRNQTIFAKVCPKKEFIFDNIVQSSFFWISNRCNVNIDWVSWLKNPNLLSL